MQEIQSILTNCYSSFSHFAIDHKLLEKWHHNLNQPIVQNSLLLECIPEQMGLERCLDVLLLANILPQNPFSDEVLPTSFQYAKKISQSILNGIYITDLPIIDQLDEDDLTAIFNLYNNKELLIPIQKSFQEYKSFINHFGSTLNLCRQAHYKIIDIVGALVQIIPSFEERAVLSDMDIPFHSKAFSMLIPTIQLLHRDGNISPETDDIPLYADRIMMQVLYSSGLFGPKKPSISFQQNSVEYAELMGCCILTLERLRHSLQRSALSIQMDLHSVHSNLLKEAALSLSSIQIEINQ